MVKIKFLVLIVVILSGMILSAPKKRTNKRAASPVIPKVENEEEKYKMVEDIKIEEKNASNENMKEKEEVIPNINYEQEAEKRDGNNFDNLVRSDEKAFNNEVVHNHPEESHIEPVVDENQVNQSPEVVNNIHKESENSNQNADQIPHPNNSNDNVKKEIIDSHIDAIPTREKLEQAPQVDVQKQEQNNQNNDNLIKEEEKSINQTNSNTQETHQEIPTYHTDEEVKSTASHLSPIASFFHKYFNKEGKLFEFYSLFLFYLAKSHKQIQLYVPYPYDLLVFVVFGYIFSKILGIFGGKSKLQNKHYI